MREIQADFDYFHTLYASKMDSISMDGKSLDGIVEDICKKYKLVYDCDIIHGQVKTYMTGVQMLRKTLIT